MNLRPGVLQHVQTALDPVGHVNQTVGVDVKIVEHRRLLSFGRRRNKEADFLGAKFISDIKDTQARIIVGNENKVLVLV